MIEKNVELSRGVIHRLEQAIYQAFEVNDFSQALSESCHQIRQLLECHQAALSYIPQGSFKLAVHSVSLSDKYARYRDYDVMPTGDGIWSMVLEKASGVRMTQAELVEHPRWRNFGNMKTSKGLEHPPMKGWLAIPILGKDDRVLGLIQFSDSYKGDFTAEDEEQARGLAKLVSRTFELKLTQEELCRSNHELETFASIASHDLRSPLRAINELAHWVLEDVAELIPEESKRHLELIRNRAQRMEYLLESLLQFARAGEIDHDIEDISTSDLLASVLELSDLPQSFEVELPKNEFMVKTPRAPIELVLRNLVGNAVKHHHKAEGRITFEITETPKFLQFSVSDDGPGIAPEYHEKVFGLFQTLSPKDEVEGSGMGLAICRKRVLRAGGKMELRSKKGKGSTFMFTWPKCVLPT